MQPISSLSRRDVLAGAAGIAGISLLPAVGRAEPSPRVAALLGRMTLEEKAGQLSCYSDEVRPLGALFNPVVNPQSAADQLAAIRAGGIGMLFNGLGVDGARRAQAVALQSRLAIPLAFAGDVLRGHTIIFPIPLAEAAAFDPDLAEASARAIAREASAGGLHWTFAPMVDLARDQRWGRVAEGAGEDPHLSGLYAAARVRGFQGDDLTRPDTLAATPKHFAGYGAVGGGMEYGEVDIAEATLREVHLPPFAAAFAAGAATVMTSFSSMSGVPATGNRRLLTEMLRGEMRFAGPAVTDYDADRELIAHGFAADEREAAKAAILAGADMSMQSGLYARHLPGLVRSGEVPLARVDEAVARVLMLKERLGLFDNPWRSLDPVVERRAIGAGATRAAAREAAVRSIVMLRNQDNLLPLARGRRLALIGPCADRAQLNGPWSYAGQTRDAVDLATGLRAAMADGGSLAVVPGCGIDAEIAGGIGAAVAAARAADIVLLAIGEGGGMSGEGNSRTEITVPAAQQRLAEAVAAVGRPIVVLLHHGRALALEGAVAAAPAILATWLLGTEAGPAIAAILFGDREPTGRLPVSFPHRSGQQPWSYDRPSTGRPPRPAGEGGGARWRDAPDTALYPFGHGLGYASFALDGLTAPDQVIFGASVPVAVRVRNTSSRAGETVVQLYLRDQVARRTRPRRLLKRFQRVRLAAGEARVLRFTLAPDDLSYIAVNTPTTDPGLFQIWAAFDAADEGVTGQFTLLDSAGSRSSAAPLPASG